MRLREKNEENQEKRMIFLIGLIVAAVIVMIMMKIARPKVGSKGTTPAKRCPDCGLPKGRCQRLKRDAETAKAFRGSVRKK